MPADTVWNAHLLNRKTTHFVLWRPGDDQFTPSLYIGNLPASGDSLFSSFREIPLGRSAEFSEVWEVPASTCGLEEGQVYFYWFKVRDTNPENKSRPILYRTDPTAWTIDRRLEPPVPTDPGAGPADFLDPASVVLFQDASLVPCDPQGQTVDWNGDSPPSTLPPNNRLVIYELPTRWAEAGTDGGHVVGVGTFRDVLAQLDPEQPAPNFPSVDELNDRAHLLELNVNALELLPPADHDDRDGWGYGTANFLSAAYYYGFPPGQQAPTASTDLAHLIKTCHQRGVRFFSDDVMAFSRNEPYETINYLDFHVLPNSGDPEQGSRDGFGGDLYKYNYQVTGYDPISGTQQQMVPARQYMKTYLDHWINYYRVDGLRLDSVNNISNYDFVQEAKEYARSLWKRRGGTDECFLVVGEELSEPMALLDQQRLDGLWHERFKQILRSVILGTSANSIGEPSFEWSVRKLIDCRLLGFADGSQAVNYVTSHDVGGFRNERLYNFLLNNQVVFTEARIKLAFACLLTAVGIPMILAGEEFADPQDLEISHDSTNKQIDPVNYQLMKDDWRRRIFDYVARLVRLRTTSEALAVNDTEFLHADFNDGKRVVVWQRGRGDQLVVVVANFSDFGTPDAANPAAEYVVPGWPATPSGKVWREMTQGPPEGRVVPQEWVAREPIFPWEAKVYATA